MVDLVLIERTPNGVIVFHDVEHESRRSATEQGAVVVIEHRWARSIADRLRGLGAQVALHVRVTPDEAAAFAATGR